MVPKEAPSGYCMLLDEAPSMVPSVTNIVWAPSVAPSMAPSVAPSLIISLIGFQFLLQDLKFSVCIQISDWINWS